LQCIFPFDASIQLYSHFEHLIKEEKA